MSEGSFLNGRRDHLPDVGEGRVVLLPKRWLPGRPLFSDSACGLCEDGKRLRLRKEFFRHHVRGVQCPSRGLRTWVEVRRVVGRDMRSRDGREDRDGPWERTRWDFWGSIDPNSRQTGLTKGRTKRGLQEILPNGT